MIFQPSYTRDYCLALEGNLSLQKKIASRRSRASYPSEMNLKEKPCDEGDKTIELRALRNDTTRQLPSKLLTALIQLQLKRTIVGELVTRKHVPESKFNILS